MITQKLITMYKTKYFMCFCYLKFTCNCPSLFLIINFGETHIWLSLKDCVILFEILKNFKFEVHIKYFYLKNLMFIFQKLSLSEFISL